MRTLGTALLLALLLTGCPGASSSSQPQQLRLSLAQAEPNTNKVGDRRTLCVMFGPQGEQQLMTNAMIATDPPTLTQWHAEPADAVQFDPTTAGATFVRAGPVRIWATVTDADGREIRSNELTLNVAQ